MAKQLKQLTHQIQKENNPEMKTYNRQETKTENDWKMKEDVVNY